jgi:rRNA maturation RNase YbeY
MKIVVIPSAARPRIDLPRTTRCAARLAALALKPRAWNEITIVVTDDRGIAKLNERFLRHRGPTDVISFRLEAVPGEKAASGEIYVNAQRAVSLAGPDWTASQELALYIAHGMDHLAGADDRTAAQRTRMLDRETGWVRKTGAKGLVAAGRQP